MRPWRIALVLGAVGLVCLIVWWHPLLHWAAIHTGTLNESGPYYGFWSGFGSDLGELTLVAGLIAFYRTHECHNATCHWPASHTTANGHKLCKKCIGKPNAALDLHPIDDDHVA